MKKLFLTFLLIGNSVLLQTALDMCQAQYSELFPESYAKGYKCIGFCEQSKKMPELKLRRIKLKHDGETYQVVPSFVMPYMTGYVEDIEKALLLHFKYEVPFDGLVYVFAKNVSYLYRQCQQIGRYSLVGTTVKHAETLPEDIAADENIHVGMETLLMLLQL